MNAYVYVAVGGVVSGAGRYWVELLAARPLRGGTFPWSTILINVAGSFILGLISAVTLPGGLLPVSAQLRTFVVAGGCVGFATVSFCLQTLELLRTGDSARLASNVLTSIMLCISAVILCIVAVMLGHALATCIGPAGAAA